MTTLAGTVHRQGESLSSTRTQAALPYGAASFGYCQFELVSSGVWPSGIVRLGTGTTNDDVRPAVGALSASFDANTAAASPHTATTAAGTRPASRSLRSAVPTTRSARSRPGSWRRLTRTADRARARPLREPAASRPSKPIDSKDLGNSMRVLKILAVLAATTVLTACASGLGGAEPVESGPRPSSNASSASGVEASAVAPESRVGLSCADLAPSNLVAGALNATTVTDLVGEPQSVEPIGYAVSARGGLSCVATGDGAEQRSVSVQILPEATTGWATFTQRRPEVMQGAAALYGDASDVFCYGTGGESSCWANILVDETWIEITTVGIVVDASLDNDAVTEMVDPLIESIVSAVRNAPAPEPLWVVPASTGILPSDCSVYATVDEFRAAFGITEPVSIHSANDGEAYGIDNAAGALAGVSDCTWVAVNTGQTWPLYVTALPGGEWAFDRSSAAVLVDVMTADGQVQPVAEPGAGIDRATFGCHVYSGFCTLDAVIAGNWVQLSAQQSLIGNEDAVRGLLVGVAERSAGAATP